MKNHAFNYLTGLLAIGSLSLCAGLLYAAIAPGSGHHLANERCSTCHMAGNDVSVENAAMLVNNQEKLCARCHPKAVKVSHPSGFAPAKKPPAMYPLDWKGDLTCSTCHDIHAMGKGKMRGALKGKPFCMSCHEASFFEKMHDGGASTLAGHLGASSIDSDLLDPYSAECMSCHENNGNVKIATMVDANGVVRHSSGGTSHPIGGDYAKLAAFGGYRPLSMLSKEILLPEGKMSCISCHKGYTSDHGKLVITNGGSSLCFQCHDL